MDKIDLFSVCVSLGYIVKGASEEGGERHGHTQDQNGPGPVLVLRVICSDSVAEAQKMSNELVGERDREWV